MTKTFGKNGYEKKSFFHVENSTQEINRGIKNVTIHNDGVVINSTRLIKPVRFSN